MNWTGLLEGLTATVRETFGQPVVYSRRNDGPVYTVTGIYDPDYLLQEGGGKVGGTARITVVDLVDADIGGPPDEGDGVLVAGISYTVASIIPTSSGMTKARLRRVRE